MGIQQTYCPKGYQEVNMHRALQRILSRHSFPLFQGPLILHLDLSLYKTKMGKWKNVKGPAKSDIIEAKTIYNHDEGLGNIFTHTEEVTTFQFCNHEGENISGVAASRENLAGLHTCKFKNMHKIEM